MLQQGSQTLTSPGTHREDGCGNSLRTQQTHEAVVKFSEVRTIPEFRDFHEKLRRQAGYFAKTRAVKLAVYFVREIERNNLIHLHLLIRTGMNDPSDVLGKIVQKASGATAELTHCENIRSVAAMTHHTVKDMADVQEGDQREPTPSWPLAHHHRQSEMESALPVISRVCRWWKETGSAV